MANVYKGKINLGITLDPNEFGGAFGLPPASHISKEMQAATYPKVFITPASSDPSLGFDTFQMNESEGRQIYNDALSGYGINLNWGSAIPFAFLPESSLTDTLTNDYGETFLQKMTDMAGEGFGQMSQMMGARSAQELAGKSAEVLAKLQKEMGEGMMSGIVGTGVGGLKMMQGVLQNSTLMQGKVGQIIDKVVTNHRFDFPMIWRNSSFNQNPTLTFRFYNPRPGSNSSHKKYILGPLALLLLLAVPRSDTEYGYNWPLFLRIDAPGFFSIKAGGISNLTIIKGGDQNQLTLAGPRVSIVDVRVEFVSLYSTMVDDSKAPGDNLLPDKPNVSTYIAALDNDLLFKRHRAEVQTEEGDTLTSLYSSIRRQDANILASKMSGENAPTVANIEEQRKEAMIARNYSASQLNPSSKKISVTNEDIDYQADNRVPEDKKELSADLIAQASDFYSRNV